MIVKEKNGEGFLDLRICDNLELMAEIKDNTIDLIYCDILYGTGRNFGDYQDLKPIRSEIESHYIPRIKEMHRILKGSGSIYLQMDWRISHWIRCIMDDIFGYDNFKNEIVWSYKRWSSPANKYQSTHDTILFYSKTNRNIFNEQYVMTERLMSAYKQGYNTNTTKNGKRQIIITDKNKVKHMDLTKFDNVIFKEPKGTLVSDVWEIPILASNSKERVGYKTQKPKKLIERIIKSSSNPGDIVADFYSGSFTTAEVCKDLKRNFIGCDINPNCLEKAKERGLFSFTDLPTNVD